MSFVWRRLTVLVGTAVIALSIEAQWDPVTGSKLEIWGIFTNNTKTRLQMAVLNWAGWSVNADYRNGTSGMGWYQDQPGVRGWFMSLDGRVGSDRVGFYRIPGDAPFIVGVNSSLVSFLGNGRVGVGTDWPDRQLEIVSADSDGVTARLVDSAAVGSGLGAGLELAGKYDGSNLNTVFGSLRAKKSVPTAGNRAGTLYLYVSSATGASQEIARFSEGLVHFSGAVTATTINANWGQDIAEWVPALGKLAPGTVVIVAPDALNSVQPSVEPYDSRVAGVVSEQPGVILGQGGDSKVMVATTGRVKVKVDARCAPIRAGDLLVTSAIPGVAMRSEAVDVGGVKMHRPGTLIGKALEPLASGEGEILVLLSLQ